MAQSNTGVDPVVIAAVMSDPVLAQAPAPPDGATDVPRNVALSWAPGQYAPAVNGHTVYLSDNFNDVNDGIGGIIQSAASYAPAQRLDLETTYYWRVDEVNGAPDYTVYPGDVWQFTTEPVGYPIANVTAAASSSDSSQGPASAVVDGSGLSDGQHSTDAQAMWLSDAAGPQPTWIEFEFDKIHVLHEMQVWNSNINMEPVIGYGFKDVTIEYSVDGVDYTTLGTTYEFAPATGTDDYAHNTTVDFGGLQAKYVRLTPNSNWKGYVVQFGLSEVRFLHIPLRARGPQPDTGATDVDVDITLDWRAGRQAARHKVYLSTDEQVVIDGTAAAVTVTEPGHTPSLDLASTYFWRVDEANDAESSTIWQGDVWSFSTPEFLVVDDFESYNDIDPPDPASNRVFESWPDGFGVATNGALVGNDIPPYAERNIVHAGGQAMPLFYSNSGAATYSEAEHTFDVPQDWTKHGVQTLSLHFYGTAGNTGQLYLKINGVKVVYDGDPADIAGPVWNHWSIELASLGVNLENVTTLALGIDGNAASGTLYVDDIVLTPGSSATATGGASILFVASMTAAVDDDLKAFMEGLGHTVTYIDDDEDEATTEAAAAAADLVFISESVSSGKIKDEITEVAVPMIVVETFAWDEMGLSEGGAGDDDAVTTDVGIVDPGHYLAAGLSGTVAVLTDITSALGVCQLGKGVTGPAGTAIATATLADGVTYDVIFVYEKGAALPVAPTDGSAQVAADIRIGYGFHANCYPVLNENAYLLLGAAIDYALGLAN
jgi:hypothetical protein